MFHIGFVFSRLLFNHPGIYCIIWAATIFPWACMAALQYTFTVILTRIYSFEFFLDAKQHLYPESLCYILPVNPKINYYEKINSGSSPVIFYAVFKLPGVFPGI